MTKTKVSKRQAEVLVAMASGWSLSSGYPTTLYNGDAVRRITSMTRTALWDRGLIRYRTPGYILTPSGRKLAEELKATRKGD